MEASWVMSPMDVVGSTHHYEREEKKGKKSSHTFWVFKRQILLGVRNIIFEKFQQKAPLVLSKNREGSSRLKNEFTNPKSVFTTKTIWTAGLTVLLFQKSHLFFDFCL